MHTSPSGKRYVGYTARSLRARWVQHVSVARGGSALPLHNAIRKYGADSFRSEVLAQVASEAEARALEIECIAAAGSLAPGGYNATSGGEGVRGTAEVRAKISNALTGRVFTDATIQRMRSAAKARMTDAAKTKLSEHWRAKGGVPNAPHGQPHTEETKQKLRAGWTPERRALVAEQQRARRAEQRRVRSGG